MGVKFYKFSTKYSFISNFFHNFKASPMAHKVHALLNNFNDINNKKYINTFGPAQYKLDIKNDPFFR